MMITALPTIAQMTGVNRILRGVAITSPTGGASLAAGDELGQRRRIIERALTLLATDIERATVWEVSE